LGEATEGIQPGAMADMNYLIQGERPRDEAIRRLRSAGFIASAPPRRLAHESYRLRVLNVAEDKQAEVDRIVREVAPPPGSQRMGWA
jgi:hypothetical protein